MVSTNNREWGFFGTARQDRGEQFAEEAWNTAFEHIDVWMGWGEYMTREFLDSRCGRHYADVMAGKDDWRNALIRYCHLESDCRAFFKEVNPAGYKLWCAENGRNSTERALKHAKISRQDILATVRNLSGMNYSMVQVENAIKVAGPLAVALAFLLADLPEEVREIYTATE